MRTDCNTEILRRVGEHGLGLFAEIQGNPLHEHNQCFVREMPGLFLVAVLGEVHLT